MSLQYDADMELDSLRYDQYEATILSAEVIFNAAKGFSDPIKTSQMLSQMAGGKLR